VGRVNKGRVERRRKRREDGGAILLINYICIYFLGLTGSQV
jgi:hypothetical protein